MRAAKLGFLISSLLCCLYTEAQVSLSSASLDGIAELRWVDADANKVEALTQQPASCLAVSHLGEPQQSAAQAGEALFYSPLLLGGQAAKAGISCASCRLNGRNDPHFSLDGVSGAAGTADVSHGFLGQQRDDDLFNPVIIPDLAAPEGNKMVARDDAEAIANFLYAQIVEEFDGPEPSKQVMSDLADYLHSLDEGCLDLPDEAITWRQEMTRARVAYDRMDQFEQSDPISAEAYKSAGRSALGRIHARYPSEEHANIRQKLETLSRLLQSGAASEEYVPTHDALAVLLQSQEKTSLYDPQSLQERLDNQ